MSAKRTSGRAVSLLLAEAVVASLAGASAAAGEAEADDAGARAKPPGLWIPGAYLCAEAKSPAELITAVAGIADAVKPGQGDQFRALLGARLGFANPAAMQAVGGESPAAFLLLNPRRYDGHVAFALGDGGAAGLVGVIARALGEEVEGDALAELGELMLGADENMFYMRLVKGDKAPWVLGARDPDALDALARAVRRGKVPRAPAGRAQLSVFADMRELRAAFGDVVAGGLQMARTGIAAMAMRPRRGGPDPKVVSPILQEYINVGEALFEGFDAFDISARITGESGEVTARAVPSAKGVFAPLAKEQLPATFAPALVFPEDGMIAAAWRLEEKASEPLVDAFARAFLRIGRSIAAGGAAAAWTCAMHPEIKAPAAGKCPVCAMDLVPAPGAAPPHPPPAQQDPAAEEKALEEYRDIMRGWLAGEFASLVIHEEGRMETLWAMDRDRAAFREMYDRTMGFFGRDLGIFLEAIGLGASYQYQEDTRRAGERQVDRVTLTYTVEGEAAEDMRRFFEAVMGGLTQVTEVTSLASGGTVAAWGVDTAKVLDRALEREAAAAGFEGRGWPGASKELEAALGRAPENTWLAFEYRMCSYVEFTMNMMRNAEPAAVALVPDPKGLGKDDVPVVGWCASENGRILYHMRVPVASIKRMVKFFEEADGGPPPPPPPPGGEEDVF